MSNLFDFLNHIGVFDTNNPYSFQECQKIKKDMSESENKQQRRNFIKRRSYKKALRRKVYD